MRDKVNSGDIIIGKDGISYLINDVVCDTMHVTYTLTEHYLDDESNIDVIFTDKFTDNWYEFAKLVSLESLEEQYGKIGYLDKLLLKLNMRTNG